jgi:peptidoglycan/xylan/chitin deacetylase (PgdA/CDA1 family)
VPSFREHLDTLERWRRFPGRERIEDGLALTFDDGPDPEATPAVLEALEAGGALATFFLVGEQVDAHPELAREIAARGHTVALHGYAHVEHETLGVRAGEDLARGLETVAAATGTRPQHYRPPYGRFSAASYEACRELGLTPFYWSAWGADWEPIPADRIADTVVRDVAPGVVVLLHDSARYAYRSSALPTAEALPAVLAAARAAGAAPVALST